MAVCKHRSAENSKKKWALRYAVSNSAQVQRCTSLRKRQKINTKSPFNSLHQRNCHVLLCVAKAVL